MPLNTTLTSETVTTDDAVCEHVKFKQGDAVYIPVTLYFNGVAINGETLLLIDKVEYALGRIVKLIDASDAWNDALGKFLLPFKQGDTLLMRPGVYDFDVRVKFYGGGVLGVREKEKIHVIDANSREVI